MIFLQAETAPLSPTMVDSIANDGLIGFFISTFDWPYIFGIIFFAGLFIFLLGKIPATGVLSVFGAINALFKKIGTVWLVILVGLLWGWALIGLRGGLTEQMIISFPMAVLFHKALLDKLSKALGLAQSPPKE